ncbi:MAG TPA: hypothetical protein VFW25_12520 [Silvibacterium sp.]|nr:hypothetical protein [Silvibacterium sp.]
MAIRTLGVALAYRQLWMYHTDTTLGWRRLSRVSVRVGERKVAAGVWRQVIDELGNHIGYQPVAAAAQRVDMDLPSQVQPVSIDAAQMEINAGVVFALGASRTAGKTEEQRLERTAVGREPEDAIERTQRKVQVFGRITAAKGDILRVWPLDVETPPRPPAERQS